MSLKELIGNIQKLEEDKERLTEILRNCTILDWADHVDEVENTKEQLKNKKLQCDEITNKFICDDVFDFCYWDNKKCVKQKECKDLTTEDCLDYDNCDWHNKKKCVKRQECHELNKNECYNRERCWFTKKYKKMC